MELPIKYAEWHPVGVCDSGLDERRKTRFFKKRDLYVVNGDGVDRDNWRNNKEIIAIINRYAMDVAELSALADGMMNPVVADIRLVGAVTQHLKTPDLNEASEEGRIQFFQVRFEDQGLYPPEHVEPEKTLPWKSWALALMLIGAFYFAIQNFRMPAPSPQAVVETPAIPLCSSDRIGSVYSKHLQIAQKTITAQFEDLPAWSALTQSKENCSRSTDSLEEQELQVLRCYLRLNRNVEEVPGLSMNLLLPVQQCITRICAQALPHLRSYCRQF